jgi:branched-chain amino acid transport system ATP-binding protein
MLDVSSIHTYYGLSHILFDVSFSISRGEIVGLLGRNGAGKSTTMRSIIGLTPPRSGSIVFKGEEIRELKTFLIFRKGIGYVPDDRRVFADLSVDDNLAIVYSRKGEWNKRRIYELFPALSDMRARRAGNLSGGEQQMLTIARSLMGSPDLLLLDEPTEGLAPRIVKSLEEQILRLKSAGISILLSEQNIRSAMRMIDRAYVIDNGRIRFSGSVDELESNDEVRKQYLMV